MPARSPTDQPNKGETAQEQGLEHWRGQRDRLIRRETWRDWFHGFGDFDFEPDEVTIDTLLEHLQNRLKDDEQVTADNIRYWQKIGVLPQPVKRWHDGATRAMYPAWAATLTIFELLELQRRGYTLQQIKPRLRAYVASIQQDDPLDIYDQVVEMARKYSDLVRTTTTEVHIRFVDADDRERTYSYSVAPDATKLSYVDLHLTGPKEAITTNGSDYFYPVIHYG